MKLLCQVWVGLRSPGHFSCPCKLFLVSGCFAAHWPLKHKCYSLTHSGFSQMTKADKTLFRHPWFCLVGPAPLARPSSPSSPTDPLHTRIGRRFAASCASSLKTRLTQCVVSDSQEQKTVFKTIIYGELYQVEGWKGAPLTAIRQLCLVATPLSKQKTIT